MNSLTSGAVFSCYVEFAGRPSQPCSLVH